MSDSRQYATCALVLAAGNGSRLRSKTPKPVHRLLGVPLLARTLFSLERAGITDAYVVLGYEADWVRTEIEKIDRIGLRIHWLAHSEWKKPNGLSVLAAESALSEPFILTMADHIFDSAIVERLLANRHLLQGIDLAVDYNLADVFDIDDATKVEVKGDRIVSIGKSLPSYQAIDTGCFLASPALFQAIRDAHAEGKSALSDGVQRLADAGLARVTDVSERLWLDIDTPEAMAEAERKLLAGVRKSTDGPISKHVNRPISAALSRQLVKTKVTPNQLSVGTLGIGIVAAISAGIGGYFGFLISGILFQTASILDGVDGEVAKLTFQSTPRGEWIDTACDQVSYIAFLIGLLIGVYRSPLPEFYFQIGVLGVLAGVVSIANISAYLIRHQESGSALTVQYGFQSGNGGLSRIMRFVQYLGKRDLLAFLALILAVFGKLPLGLVLFGIGGTFLLLPATSLANLSSLRRAQRLQKAQAAIPVSRAQHDTA